MPGPESPDFMPPEELDIPDYLTDEEIINAQDPLHSFETVRGADSISIHAEQLPQDKTFIMRGKAANFEELAMTSTFMEKHPVAAEFLTV